MTENSNMRYKTYLSAHEIAQLVDHCASKTNLRNHGGKDVFICILDGGMFFYTDLLRAMVNQNAFKQEVITDTIKVSSYKGTTQGDVQITKWPSHDLNGCNVWLVDDMVDSGKSIRFVTDMLAERFPDILDINVVTLLKRSGADVGMLVDRLIYGQVVTEDGWLHGYGFDDNGMGRHLPYIMISC